MNAIPKGFQVEASVVVEVVPRIKLLTVSVEPLTVSRGKPLTIRYEIESYEDVPQGIWLGASFRDEKSGKMFYNMKEDKDVALLKGVHTYTRTLTVSTEAPISDQSLMTGIWERVPGDMSQSRWVVGGRPLAIRLK
jgi:hypothetical protein